MLLKLLDKPLTYFLLFFNSINHTVFLIIIHLFLFQFYNFILKWFNLSAESGNLKRDRCNLIKFAIANFWLEFFFSQILKLHWCPLSFENFFNFSALLLKLLFTGKFHFGSLMSKLKGFDLIVSHLSITENTKFDVSFSLANRGTKLEFDLNFLPFFIIDSVRWAFDCWD